jgi:ribosome-binding ATPase
MKEAGIAETALSLLTRTLLASLGLISYFTVGEDEVRQWMVRKGALAPEAAGAIHSDIQRGFIRAEVMKYNDLVPLGSEDAVKKAGKHLLMGKDYLVEDGDIINFRFNV